MIDQLVNHALQSPLQVIFHHVCRFFHKSLAQGVWGYPSSPSSSPIWNAYVSSFNSKMTLLNVSAGKPFSVGMIGVMTVSWPWRRNWYAFTFLVLAHLLLGSRISPLIVLCSDVDVIWSSCWLVETKYHCALSTILASLCSPASQARLLICVERGDANELPLLQKQRTIRCFRF